MLPSNLQLLGVLRLFFLCARLLIVFSSLLLVPFSAAEFDCRPHSGRPHSGRQLVASFFTNYLVTHSPSQFHIYKLCLIFDRVLYLCGNFVLFRYYRIAALGLLLAASLLLNDQIVSNSSHHLFIVQNWKV